MNIGIVGAGHIGFGMGRLWAEKGHRVYFSHSRSPAQLAAAVTAAGIHATVCTPVEAAQCAQVLLLALHWPQVPRVIGEIQPYLAGKLLLTCAVPWNLEHNGLCVGTVSSAAEEIARLATDAHVVEVLPLLAEALYAPSRRYAPSRQLGSEWATVFYCGDDEPAKEIAARLLAELDLQPVDAGDLTGARFLEPAAALLTRLARDLGEGTDIALKLVRRCCDPSSDALVSVGPSADASVSSGPSADASVSGARTQARPLAGGDEEPLSRLAPSLPAPERRPPPP